MNGRRYGFIPVFPTSPRPSHDASLKGSCRLALRKSAEGIPLPRFHKIGLLRVLPRNVAGTMAEMPVSPAAFPQNRPSVRSSKKRGRHYGRNSRFPCRISRETATCAFWQETWPALWPKCPFPPPRFRKIGLLRILPRNVARIMAVMAIFPCRVSAKSAFCAFCQETRPALCRNARFPRRVSAKSASCASCRETWPTLWPKSRSPRRVSAKSAFCAF